MRSRRRWLLVLVLAIVVAGVVAKAIERRGPPARDLPGRPLDIGTAVNELALEREPGYRKLVRREFSAVTPENAMKWGVLEPERGKLDWSGADRVVDLGKPVRGHTLLWWNQLPAWVAPLKGDELRQVIREHIRRTTERFRGKVDTWDVVNEPLDERGELRDDQFRRELGPGWVEDAGRTAKVGDPEAKLHLNETAADGRNPKSDGLLRLVRGLQDRGVPIDGVGFQAHLTAEDGVPPGFRENLERFKALGLEVAVTELDVSVDLPASPEDLRRQAAVYAQVGRTCEEVGCSSLTVWGFTDRHSWIPGTQPGRGAATLLDEDYDPKPAHRALRRALRDG